MKVYGKRLTNQEPPVRIHPACKQDIEVLRNKYDNAIPFTQASYIYTKKKKELEEQNIELKKKLEEYTNFNARRNRLL